MPTFSRRVCVGENGFVVVSTKDVHPRQNNFAIKRQDDENLSWRTYNGQYQAMANVRRKALITTSPVSINTRESLVTFPDFSVKKYKARTPYFLEHHNYSDLVKREKTFLMIDTVRNFIKKCKGNCTSLLQDQKQHLIHRTQYNAGLGDEVDMSHRSMKLKDSDDLEKLHDVKFDSPGLSTDMQTFEKLWDCRNSSRAPVIVAAPCIMGHVPNPPQLPVIPSKGGERQDMKNWLSGMASSLHVNLKPCRSDLVKGKHDLMLNPASLYTPMRWGAGRQNLKSLMDCNTQAFLQKLPQTRQIMFGDVDEAFQIAYLLAKEENQFLQRLFHQVTKGTLSSNKHFALAAMFWSGCEFSTLRGNYGPQIKAFVDYLHGHDIHFHSVARFVLALQDEATRIKIGRLVPSYFSLRVPTKSSNSSSNWWGAINYCFVLHSSSLKQYAPKILKRSIKRAFASLSEPTEGFFVREWTNLIYSGLTSSDPEIYLETLFLIYMMRMALRCNTTAQLLMSGLTLIFDRETKLYTLHQWGIKAKNCNALLGDIPKFSKVREEPDSPLKPYICAVWALKQILLFRNKLGVNHDYFLFDIHGNRVTPSQWLSRVTSRLKSFQAQFAQNYPLIAHIRIGGHTPRKTYSNIATHFNFPKEEVRMMLRNTSWNCIREHYLKNSRAYNEAKAWSSHILTCEMTSSERNSAIDLFSSVMSDKQRKQWIASLEYPE